MLRRAALEHAAALHEAIGEVYGVESAGTKVDVAGRTDLEISRAILVQLGVSSRRIDEGLADLRAAAAEAYARRVPDDLSSTVLPGMADLLAELAPRDDVLLSLVTGNLQPIARLKLGAAGIGGYFPSGQGGFGSDSEDRTRLPAVARARAGTVDDPHPRGRTVVIGDTPRDIACARADGVRVLAVATGRYRAAELVEADAVTVDGHGLRRLIGEMLR